MASVCGWASHACSLPDSTDVTLPFSIARPWIRKTRYGRPPFCKTVYSTDPSPSLSAVSPKEAPPSTHKKKPKIRQLLSMSTPYNEITVIDIPPDMPSEFAGSRLLLLDESGNVHSIYKDDCKWTNAYWDQFATLPPIVPEGPIAILGLGGGTSARLMLDLWPSCELLGWEIDGVLVDVARTYFGLSELEVPTPQGGMLEVHLDDALQPSATVDGGFAGIIVDLFANGEVLPQLRQPETWFDLKKRLRDGGRIMINCGGICVEKSDPMLELDNGTWTWEDGGYAKEATLTAIVEAFPQTLFRKLGGESDNYMALTGPLPDLATWAAVLPTELQIGLSDWRTFSR